MLRRLVSLGWATENSFNFFQSFPAIDFPKNISKSKHPRTPENVCAVSLFLLVMQGHQRHNHPSPAAGRYSVPVCCWVHWVVLLREEQMWGLFWRVWQIYWLFVEVR